MPKIFYTEEEFLFLKKKKDLFEKFFRDYERKQSNLYNEKNGYSKNFYHFIPLDVDQFLDQIYLTFNLLKHDSDILNTNYEYNNFKFLDVGCGIGSKMWIVTKLYNCKIHGLEINDIYINEAYKTFGLSKNLFTIINALNYEHYSTHDIIYFYCPCKDFFLQKNLEIKIKTDMKIGSFLLANLSKTYDNEYLDDKNIQILNKKFKIIKGKNSPYQILQKIKS